MNRLRRLTGILAGTLVLQLTLLGAATPCSDHGAGEAAPNAHLAMSDQAEGEDQHDCGETTKQGNTRSSSDGSCVAMISCVTPLLAAVDRSPAFDVDANSVVSLTPLQPPTRHTAPELPPPRV